MDSIADFLSRLLAQPTGGLTVLQAVGAFFVAYAGGVLSSLTPCVYPMIPITVSVVGGLGHGKRTWHQVAVRSLVYVSGMTVIYSFLGVLAGLTGKVFGTMTNTTGWYMALGVVMTLAALMMLDIIPFDPLAWWERFKLAVKRGRKSSDNVPVNPVNKAEITLLGAFVLGASSGFIAAPCTTPILTAILAYIAKSQSVGLGLALMFGFSIGMGTLLLAIGFFAGALQILPKSGKWMKAVKLISGILLLFFAEYLIYKAGKAGGF